VLSGLTSSFGGSWVPLLDTKQAFTNAGDRMWPVSVLHGRLQAVKILDEMRERKEGKG